MGWERVEEAEDGRTLCREDDGGQQPDEYTSGKAWRARSRQGGRSSRCYCEIAARVQNRQRPPGGNEDGNEQQLCLPLGTNAVRSSDWDTCSRAAD